mmetsp:Transcript_53489/g.114388  ORF Transcript_53489/g.114388 Transcript_53489/m.114388 type:complete len:666 (+) Transcript_53489:64-2061(+)
MGNVLELPKEPEHRLELRFEHPNNLPTGSEDGSQRRLVAQLHLLNSATAAAIRTVDWEQTVTMTVPRNAVIVLDIYLFDPATEPRHTFVAQVCLPFAGLKELGIDGDSVPLRLALWPERPTSQVPRAEILNNFQRDLQLCRPDSPNLTVWARETTQEPPPAYGPPTRFYSADMAMLNSASLNRGPTKRREAIQLAFENAELEARLMPPSSVDPTRRGIPGEHIRQLQSVYDQNEHLKAQCQDVWNRIETAQKTQRMQASNSAMKDRHRDALDLLQQELAKNQERYRKLQEEYHTHISDLKEEIIQARAEADSAELKVAALSTPPQQAPEVPPSKGKGKGQGSRHAIPGRSGDNPNSLESQFDELRDQVEDLDRQLRAAQKHKDMYDQARAASPSEMALLLPPEHEARAYLEMDQKNKAELKEIQDALEELDADRERRGLTEVDKYHKRINELYEELDQAQIEREDQRVRDESEVQELKADCDKLRGEIDEINDETGRFEAQVEALKLLGVMPRSQRSLNGPTDPVQDVRNELQALNEKLNRSREEEQFKSAALEELEQEQELLIERLGTFSAASFGERGVTAPPPLAEVIADRVKELRRELDEVESSVMEKESEVERLRAAATETAAIVEAMKQHYDARVSELEKQARGQFGGRAHAGLMPPMTS